MKVHPLYLALPVTIACSFSFMMPAATPPNAIVFELGRMTIPEMVSWSPTGIQAEKWLEVSAPQNQALHSPRAEL